VPQYVGPASSLLLRATEVRVSTLGITGNGQDAERDNKREQPTDHGFLLGPIFKPSEPLRFLGWNERSAGTNAVSTCFTLRAAAPNIGA
jgi:hypothetical protein